MSLHATCIPVHMLLYLSRTLDKHCEVAMTAQYGDLSYAMLSHIQLTITACSALHNCCLCIIMYMSASIASCCIHQYCTAVQLH